MSRAAEKESRPAEETLRLLREGKSLEEIAARRDRQTESVAALIADLIAQGVSGVKGYTDEPLVQAVASPSIVFDRYTRGWTLAESFYAGSALVGWQDLVIGDPLARAYPAQ